MEYLEMKVVAAKRLVTYEKRKGVTGTMRAYTIEDDNGNKHEAVAWGDLCYTLELGAKVKVIKWFSPGRKETEIDRYIIMTELS